MNTNESAPDLRETVYGLGSVNVVHLDGDFLDYGEGNRKPLVNLIVDVANESLTIVFDLYHLTEFRKSVQRAERWVKGEEFDKAD